MKTQDAPKSVRFIKGVGPQKEKTLSRLGLYTTQDVLYWFPKRYEQRYPLKTIRDLTGTGKECVWGQVAKRGVIRLGYGRNSIFKATLRCDNSFLTVIYYHQPYLVQIFKPGAIAVMYGQAEKKGKYFEMVHPEYEMFDNQAPPKTAHYGCIVPIYPLTEDLTQKNLRLIVSEILRQPSVLMEEFLPAKARRVLCLCDLDHAIRQIHYPDNEVSLKRSFERLVFDEFFFLQLEIGMKRMRIRMENSANAHTHSFSQVDTFIQSLPFKLTQGQSEAVNRILSDMKSRQPMNRLVQADVGSGKTAVAATALYFTVLSGFQGAMMAPTEVLAQQNYFNLCRFLEPHGMKIGYLANEVSLKDRERIYQDTANGSLDILAGTHALLEQKVQFKKMGLAVVDEQHKFGFQQREDLRKKNGKGSHFLLLTATPIPQTLAMTLYGDMDVSVVSDKPADRGSVYSHWFKSSERDRVYQWCGKALEEGSQAYIISPWVDSGGNEPGVKNVLAVYQDCQKNLKGYSAAVLHGKLGSKEKTRIMKEFKEGKISVLVSTVVVEVGVDVPAARFMIIENAEKFGLAQLHQLRGRIGRSQGESHCVVLSDSENQESTRRLEAFVGTQSGFEIAEKDLEFRGAGEAYGHRQHGFLKFRIGDLVRDKHMMIKAKRSAEILLEKDPDLAMPEHEAIKRNLAARQKNKI